MLAAKSDLWLALQICYWRDDKRNLHIRALVRHNKTKQKLMGEMKVKTGKMMISEGDEYNRTVP